MFKSHGIGRLFLEPDFFLFTFLDAHFKRGNENPDIEAVKPVSGKIGLDGFKHFGHKGFVPFGGHINGEAVAHDFMAVFIQDAYRLFDSLTFGDGILEIFFNKLVGTIFVLIGKNEFDLFNAVIPADEVISEFLHQFPDVGYSQNLFQFNPQAPRCALIEKIDGKDFTR
jgi:hypothetical protein